MHNEQNIDKLCTTLVHILCITCTVGFPEWRDPVEGKVSMPFTCVVTCAGGAARLSRSRPVFQDIDIYAYSYLNYIHIDIQ